MPIILSWYFLLGSVRGYLLVIEADCVAGILSTVMNRLLFIPTVFEVMRTVRREARLRRHEQAVDDRIFWY